MQGNQSAYDQFSAAILKRDEQTALSLISQVGTLFWSGQGLPLLHQAVRAGFVSVVKNLRAAGAPIMPARLNLNGYTPLHDAAGNGDLEMITELLTPDSNKVAANIAATDQNGYTAMEYAAKGGHVAAMQLLQKHGAVASGATLRVAALHNQTTAVSYLKRQDCNTGNDHVFSMHAAARHGNSAMFSNLLLLGESVDDLGLRGTPDDLIGLNGITPLLVAAQHGHTNTVQFLTNLGADVNRVSTRKETALGLAALHGHVEVIKVLIMARANTMLPNQIGLIPLYQAACRGHEAVVNELSRATVVDQNDRNFWATILITAVLGFEQAMQAVIDLSGAPLGLEEPSYSCQSISEEKQKRLQDFLLRVEAYCIECNIPLSSLDAFDKDKVMTALQTMDVNTVVNAIFTSLPAPRGHQQEQAYYVLQMKKVQIGAAETPVSACGSWSNTRSEGEVVAPTSASTLSVAC